MFRNFIIICHKYAQYEQILFIVIAIVQPMFVTIM